MENGFDATLIHVYPPYTLISSQNLVYFLQLAGMLIDAFFDGINFMGNLFSISFRFFSQSEKKMNPIKKMCGTKIT